MNYLMSIYYVIFLFPLFSQSELIKADSFDIMIDFTVEVPKQVVIYKGDKEKCLVYLVNEMKVFLYVINKSDSLYHRILEYFGTDISDLQSKKPLSKVILRYFFQNQIMMNWKPAEVTKTFYITADYFDISKSLRGMKIEKKFDWIECPIEFDKKMFDEPPPPPAPPKRK